MGQEAPSRRSVVVAAIVVFVIAVTVRVPSCYESFWLDELHSAWCIWSTLADVFPRAELGHQSPFYFVGLWFWKQLVGESEVALRLSSVLAVAAGSVVLTAGVTRWTKSLAAGTASGMVLALESNSLFFGTELRPYAFVILFASLATICFVRLVNVDSRRDVRGDWSTFILAILLAALVQPTSVGVLSSLPMVLLVVWFKRDRRQLCKWTLTDALVGLTVAAIGFTIFNVMQGETWQQRAMWASFANATRAGQIWEAWDWTWMLIVPLGFMLLAAIMPVLRNRITPHASVIFTTVLLALLAVSLTSLYWAVSRGGWMPLWHRRYFVAVLPMLACVVGGAVGAVQSTLGASPRARAAAWIAALVLLLGSPEQRELLSRLRDYPVALVARGENWRDAVAWVRARASRNDLVLLDSGLIEAKHRLPPTGRTANELILPENSSRRHSVDARITYLTFPVSGPYRLEQRVVPIRPDESFVFKTNSAKRRIYWITRRPPHQMPAPLPSGSRLVGFGNVTVVQQSSELDRSF